MMDYNAPPNSCTFGKAQWELGISSGLSNFDREREHEAPLEQKRFELHNDQNFSRERERELHYEHKIFELFNYQNLGERA